MKLKRIILFIVVALMLAPHAFAAGKGKTLITAACTIPDIVVDVTVPASGQVYINPLSLPVRLDGAGSASGQILTAPVYLENKSIVPLKVGATVYGIEKGDLYFSKTTTQGTTETRKKAFVYFEMHAASSPTQVTWDSAYNESKHLLVTGSDKTNNNMLVLGAGETGKRYGVFRLSGDCVAEPREAWTARDGFNVKITFTFTPLPMSANP